jgi:hypothetical protein
MYLDGEYDILDAGIDNAGSEGQLAKFRAKPMVAKHMLRISAILRTITNPLVHYYLVKSENHIAPDMVSRSLDPSGLPIPSVEKEILEWETKNEVTLNWVVVPQWIIDLVFPKSHNVEIQQLMAPLRDMLKKAATTATTFT